MKIFEVQKNLTSYRYPLIKIVICILLVAVCLFRNRLFDISVRWLEICLSVVAFAVTIPAILCVYISCGEMMETYYNRKERKKKRKNKKDAQQGSTP